MSRSRLHQFAPSKLNATLLQLDLVQPPSSFTARHRWGSGVGVRRQWWWTEWHTEKRSCHVRALTVKTNIFCVCPVRFLIPRSKSHHWKPACDSGAFREGSMTPPSGDAVNHAVQSIGTRVLVPVMDPSDWCDGPGASQRGRTHAKMQMSKKTSIDLYHHNKSLCQLPAPRHRHPRPHPTPRSLPGLRDAASNGRAGSGSSDAAPKRRHFGCRSALEQITLTPPPRGDCIRDTCNYEIWRVMKGESMSPRREFQRWTRRREHGGESNHVKSFSGHPRGREIVLCHNESEENIDVLWSDGDLPRFSRLSASLKRLFFLSFFVIKADGVKVFTCTPDEMFSEPFGFLEHIDVMKRPDKMFGMRQKLWRVIDWPRGSDQWSLCDELFK